MDWSMETFDEGIEMSSSDLARVLLGWRIPLAVQFPGPFHTPPLLDAVRHHGKTCISSTVSSHMSGRDTCPLLQTNNTWNLKLAVISRTNCWKMFVFRLRFHICAMVKSRVCLGMVIPSLIGNPYNGYINPYYWVDDHPLLYGNNGSLDPGTYETPGDYVLLMFSQTVLWSENWMMMELR